MPAIAVIMVGCFQFEGLVAIFNDTTFYVATRNYLFQFDATTWGWIPPFWGWWWPAGLGAAVGPDLGPKWSASPWRWSVPSPTSCGCPAPTRSGR